ncbi:hypothetical protein M0R45_036378 [Rubus argutus]|uniref:Uncharacterized protein n=1 Tax=Rubus argutus TaxID=59490 RepID=A0AAW1VZP7_RUBAR
MESTAEVWWLSTGLVGNNGVDGETQQERGDSTRSCDAGDGIEGGADREGRDNGLGIDGGGDWAEQSTEERARDQVFVGVAVEKRWWRSGVGKARTRPGHGFGDLRLVNSVLQVMIIDGEEERQLELKYVVYWRLGEEEKCEIDGVEKRKKMVR